MEDCSSATSARVRGCEIGMSWRIAARKPCRRGKQDTPDEHQQGSEYPVPAPDMDTPDEHRQGSEDPDPAPDMDTRPSHMTGASTR